MKNKFSISLVILLMLCNVSQAKEDNRRINKLLSKASIYKINGDMESYKETRAKIKAVAKAKQISCSSVKNEKLKSNKLSKINPAPLKNEKIATTKATNLLSQIIIERKTTIIPTTKLQEITKTTKASTTMTSQKPITLNLIFTQSIMPTLPFKIIIDGGNYELDEKSQEYKPAYHLGNIAANCSIVKRRKCFKKKIGGKYFRICYSYYVQVCTSK